MSLGINDQMLLIRANYQVSLIKCPKSYAQLINYILHRFELNLNQISGIYYLDDEGDSIRIERDDDVEGMILNNSQTKIICVNVQSPKMIKYSNSFNDE